MNTATKPADSAGDVIYVNNGYARLRHRDGDVVTDLAPGGSVLRSALPESARAETSAIMLAVQSGTVSAHRV